ncbi:MAG TPA: hypothetical protein VK674_02910 [Candidatus Limnocylindria bacterium]|nr:hypothetical protein [Candidatus Limnocylindria bacterium]
MSDIAHPNPELALRLELYGRLREELLPRSDDPIAQVTDLEEVEMAIVYVSGAASYDPNGNPSSWEQTALTTLAADDFYKSVGGMPEAILDPETSDSTLAELDEELEPRIADHRSIYLNGADSRVIHTVMAGSALALEHLIGQGVRNV